MSQTQLARSLESFERKKRDCLELADAVIGQRRLFDEFFSVAGDEAGDRLEALRNRLADARLKILVAGQFKTGKSTLLNAILGIGLLPEDVTPCTAVITEIEYGTEAEACLHFKQDLKLADIREDLCGEVLEHLEKYGQDQAPPMRVSLDKPERLASFLTIPPASGNDWENQESPFARCVIKWPLELCKSGAILIDSPGLNEHKSRDATTMGYLDEADAILHVLAASHPCGMPDKKFIEEVEARGNGTFPIIFAVNRFDQLGNDVNRAKIREYALKLKELDGVYGKEAIFFTSGLAALEGRLNGDAQKLAASGIPALENFIATVFEKDRAKIKLGNIKELVRELDSFNDAYLRNLASLLAQDAALTEQASLETAQEFQRLEQEIERIRKKVDRVADRFEKGFSYAMSDFFNEFCRIRLPELVKNVELEEIGVFNRESASRQAVDLLNAAVNEGLAQELKSWLYGEGRALENAAIQEIQEDIHDNLEEFSETLLRVRENMHLEPISGVEEAKVDFLDFMPDALAGAGVGGAVGYTAVFIASRFLPVIAGPAGWAVVAISSALMAVWVLLAGADGRDKLKNSYLEEVEKNLRAHLSQNIAEISRAAGTRFRQGVVELHTRLEEKMQDVRKPLEIALKSSRQKEADIRQQRQKLAEFSKIFEDLRKRAHKLAEDL